MAASNIHVPKINHITGMALLSMCIQLMQEQIMDKIAWVMAEIGMSNSNSNEEMVKVTKMDRLKQTPADMTGNELDFNVKRRKNNMNKNQGNFLRGLTGKLLEEGQISICLLMFSSQ